MPTVNHVLDNPAWHAFISGNKNLALGTDTAKAFPEEVSPIAGLQEYTTANFNTLYDITTSSKPVVIFTVDEPLISDVWSVLVSLTGLQMVYTGSALPVLEADEKIAPLTDEHIPQMLALTKLTNPGPFSSRTIDFGHYEGIFKEEQLIAMAGQRLHPFDYAEISAVCTHPSIQERDMQDNLSFARYIAL
jgi:hypothetical protein